MLQDRVVVLRKNFLRREAGQMDHAPEAIASSDKMMPRRGCVDSGIDPAEDHSQAASEDIRERIGHDVACKQNVGIGFPVLPCPVIRRSP